MGSLVSVALQSLLLCRPLPGSFLWEEEGGGGALLSSLASLVLEKGGARPSDAQPLHSLPLLTVLFPLQSS